MSIFHNFCILGTCRKLFINEMDIPTYFLEDHPFLKTNTFSLIEFHSYVCLFHWMDVECRYHKLVMYSHAQWRVNHDFSRDIAICIEIKNMSDSHLFYLHNIFTTKGFPITCHLLLLQLQEFLRQVELYAMSHFKLFSGLSLLQCGRQYKNKQMVIQEDKCPVPTEYPKSNFLWQGW